MRFWLAKSSEVPLREQLVRQIILGVVSNDLKSGERLPSTRELARRFAIHSNTVSGAYRELAERGWVAFRKGSGVFVKVRAAEQALDASLQLDQLISGFFKTAREQGHSLAKIQSTLKRWLTLQAPDHFLLIEPDPELRLILGAEIEQATGVRVENAGTEKLSQTEAFTGAVPVAMYGQVDKLGSSLPVGVELIPLRSNSVPESLRGEKLPSRDVLIGIVSRWPEFLRWSRIMLVAAGLDADALNFRDAREKGWQKGLSSTQFVITDSQMAARLPPGCTARVFRIISDSSIAELRAYVELFFE